MVNDVQHTEHRLSTMNAIARRRQHKEELRRVILEAARNIFVHQGYENFSMRKLAEEIEYSPGERVSALQEQRGTVRVPCGTEFRTSAEDLNGFAEWTGTAGPSRRTEEGDAGLRRIGLCNPNDYRFVFMLKPPAEKRPYKVHGAFEVLRKMVRRCVEEKRFRAVDIETTAQALWTSVHGITSLLIQRPTFPWVSKKKLIGQVINMAVDGLIAEPRRK